MSTNGFEKEKIEYQNEVYRQTHPYQQWCLQKQEKQDELKEIRDLKTDSFVLFAHKDGILLSLADRYFAKLFWENENCILAYADEDYLITEKNKNQIHISSDGVAEVTDANDSLKVTNPWLKPDWSPDTIKSFFYFGNIFAIKRCEETEAVLSKFEISEYENRYRFSDEERMVLWDLVCELCSIRFPLHLSEILFHYSGTENWEDNYRFPAIQILEELKQKKLVSIIIPSKDHPLLLNQCLNSIDKLPEYAEIIIVDNGSSEENKKEIEALLEIKKNDFHSKYIFEPMDFNFSRMCNLGAKNASGRVLLFLNDDITVLDNSWLEIMVSQALEKNTGAVGAKLYYPDSQIIQHVGITNMSVGPAHKLGGSDDKLIGEKSTDETIPKGKSDYEYKRLCRNLYHNRNRANYNVIAVTAAALAIEKSKFELVGGFDEMLAVAYNDVDLGFSLYEQGFYNVVRNDVVMYHHESVSRGSDESIEKRERLLEERKKLYEKHPALYCRDPFYHKDLVQYRLDADYHINYIYEHEEMELLSKTEQTAEAPKQRKNIVRKLLRKGPEIMMNIDQIKWQDNRVIIEGWGNLVDEIPLGYERKLILQSEAGTCYFLQLFDKYRPDVGAVLTKQEYNKLSGFVAKSNRISHGKYRVGICFKNGKGKQKIFYIPDFVSL